MRRRRLDAPYQFGVARLTLMLKRHQVAEQALSHQDVDADVRCINDLLAPLVSS
ncbi:MAG: hypothetical protein ABSE84_25075 [Isosphaeraceae bacterium]